MKHVYLIAILFFFVSCQEAAFYEKEILKEMYAPDDIFFGDSNVPGSNDGGSNDGGSNDGGSNDGAIPQTDTFTQSTQGGNKVDILWVIDNSGSMGDNQRELADNFDSFISGFIQKNLDFQMFIITTDPRHTKAGIQVPRCDELLNDEKAAQNEIQFLEDFKSMIKVGTNGSGNEKGLYATEKFIERYKDHPNKYFRDGAYLAVVFVSDEEDQSSEAVDYYISKLEAEKGNAGLVRAYSIVDTIGSSSFNGISSGFYRYAQASEMTNGQYADISSNFASTLSNIGNNIVYLAQSFPLSHKPMGAIEVYVDNVKVLTGWDYDSIQNVVSFDENSIPENGAKIEISYNY